MRDMRLQAQSYFFVQNLWSFVEKVKKAKKKRRKLFGIYNRILKNLMKW